MGKRANNQITKYMDTVSDANRSAVKGKSRIGEWGVCVEISTLYSTAMERNFRSEG